MGTVQGKSYSAGKKLLRVLCGGRNLNGQRGEDTSCSRGLLCKVIGAGKHKILSYGVLKSISFSRTRLQDSAGQGEWRQAGVRESGSDGGVLLEGPSSDLIGGCFRFMY